MSPVFGLDEGGGPMAAMGLGWVVMEPQGNRPLILQKTGGYQGTLSYVAFAPSRDIGVFISMNAFKFDGFTTMVGIAVSLIEQLAPR
jgi:D-alanyl-D-alanine-carboxypeptidase/D-alanyl-D-alanine-endopeptidase